MHVLRYVSLLVFTLPLTVFAQDAPPAKEDPSAFADALNACEPATFKMPHPLIRPFFIVHTVHGPKEGRCRYDQTMPGDMTMECAFDEEGRKLMAEEIRKMARGEITHGSTKGPQPAWTKQCEVVTKDGQRMPFGR
ncbi:MAG TPA: hypothetical protein VNK41_06650 [Vicinamibacterales bacterium]|nr:hypothetical protein [Vicinamibacterales bacterium]